MKRLSAVAFVLLMAVSASFGYWNYFPVIEGGKGEANINSNGGIKIRYGATDQIELFATNAVGGLNGSSYGIGGRYQIIPEMFSFSLDLGIPYNSGEPGSCFGIVPAVQFSKGITDKLVLAGGAGLGLDFSLPNGKTKDGKAEDGMLMNLDIGVELDYNITDVVLVWAGVNYIADAMNLDKAEDAVIAPAVGVQFYLGDNLILGTSVGIDLNAQKYKDGVPDGKKETIGFSGGVDFSVKF
ncbi:MAG: hypothetical protein LBI42_00535 [Chitinispirillales bacterium]|jgi:hypothetical protein|nr:hypothetical protein [Chitinispirillales bacterium]